MRTNEQLAEQLAIAERNVEYYTAEAAYWRDRHRELTVAAEERLKAPPLESNEPSLTLPGVPGSGPTT